jgi:hypothetical protein
MPNEEMRTPSTLAPRRGKRLHHPLLSTMPICIPAQGKCSPYCSRFRHGDGLLCRWSLLFFGALLIHSAIRHLFGILSEQLDVRNSLSKVLSPLGEKMTIIDNRPFRWQER